MQEENNVKILTDFRDRPVEARAGGSPEHHTPAHRRTDARADRRPMVIARHATE